MFMLDIICPYCGKTHTYSFGQGKCYELGDYVSGAGDTSFHVYQRKCISCNYHLFLFTCVENGKFINVVLEPDDEETWNLENLHFKHLDNYPNSVYDYKARSGLLLGEVTDVIPSQYSTSLKLKRGDNVNAFKKWWTVDESYKVFKKGKLYERIYKVSLLDGLDRLLILRDNSIPVLKAVKWNLDSKVSDDNKMMHSISQDMEIVMDVS